MQFGRWQWKGKNEVLKRAHTDYIMRTESSISKELSLKGSRQKSA